MSEPTEVKRLRGDLSWVLSMENNDKLDALLDATRREERERCAKVAEGYVVHFCGPHPKCCKVCLTAGSIAAAIRVIPAAPGTGEPTDDVNHAHEPRGMLAWVERFGHSIMCYPCSTPGQPYQFVVGDGAPAATVMGAYENARFDYGDPPATPPARAPGDGMERVEGPWEARQTGPEWTLHHKTNRCAMWSEAEARAVANTLNYLARALAAAKGGQDA